MKRSSIIVVCCIVLASGGLIAGLYARAGEDLTYSQNFYRLYEDSIITLRKMIDVHEDEYFISGVSDGKLFICPDDSSLTLKTIDLSSYALDSLKVQLAEPQKLIHPRIQIDSPFFYVKDGALPGVFFGKIDEWRASTMLKKPIYFSQAVPGAGTSVALVSLVTEQNKEDYRNVLALSDNSSSDIDIKDNILEPQIDKIFSTAGFLRYSKTMNYFVYLYQYRNKYQLLDSSLVPIGDGKTVDSVSVVKIKPMVVGDDVYSLASPPGIVNRNCQVYKDMLFVHSNLKDGYEKRSDFDNASVIDVYNLVDRKYLYSFYLKDIEGTKLDSFYVSHNKVFAQFKNFIRVYHLNVDNIKAL